MEDYFNEVTQVVIDKLEGGYFHPDMRTKNPGKFGAYHRSGETMFGLDRHAGHDLFYSTPRKTKDVLENLKYIYNGSYTYKNEDAKEFWTTIDKANARKNWPWLYKGGSNEKRLKELTGKIMYPKYENLANKYLSEKSKKLVESDPRILFHFIYAVWNGPGWFQKFAQKFNDAVEKGVVNKDELLEVALNSRINSGNTLISNGGKKIKGFINSVNLPEVKKTENLKGSSNSSTILPTSLIIAGIIVGGYYIYSKYL
jgi:hypothetical protein